MGTVDLGASVTVSWPTAPAGGTVALSTTAPDGTTGPAPTPAGSPPTASFVPTMAGRWLVRWTSTVVAGAYTDIVDVWPNDPQFIISLEDAKNALAITAQMTPANLDDLRLYVAAATPVIEDIVGKVVRHTVTQTFFGGGYELLLWEPAVSIQTITENGVTTTDYTPDFKTGIVRAGTMLAPRNFAGGAVVITYTAGSAVVDPNIRLGTRELVRHMWQLGHQSNRSPQQPQIGDAWTPSGFAVPRRVIELCSPSANVGWFA